MTSPLFCPRHYPAGHNVVLAPCPWCRIEALTEELANATACAKEALGALAGEPGKALRNVPAEELYAALMWASGSADFAAKVLPFLRKYAEHARRVLDRATEPKARRGRRRRREREIGGPSEFSGLTTGVRRLESQHLAGHTRKTLCGSVLFPVGVACQGSDNGQKMSGSQRVFR